MKKENAGMEKIIALIIAAAVTVSFSGCVESGLGKEQGNPKEKRSQEKPAASDRNDPEQEENPDYEVKSIRMSDEEIENVTGKLSHAMKKAESVYAQAGVKETSDVTLKEDKVHEMIDLIAGNGCAVICGSRDDNMKNYESVDESLRKAKRGESADTEFYSVNINGVFRYYRFTFEKGRMAVTFASAGYQEDLRPAIRQMEKIWAYDWDYTEKGWLIWEKALSRNQEMDMHMFYRILPLNEMCRRISEEYIEPISYFSNNLFLVDWDMKNPEKIEFNDLFDALYAMDTGMKADKEKYEDGIPEELFENTIERYFDMTGEQIKQYADYNKEKGTYPWLAVSAWNRIPQLQPFPEVVKCEEHDDGTLSAYVEAVLVESGRDCSFRHVVTLKKDEKGNYKYWGNQVDEENAYWIPKYRARRQF